MKKKNKHLPRFWVFTNIIFIILLLASIFSGIINPETSNIFAFLGLGYYVIFIINLLFIFIWLFISKKLFIINLIIVLLGSKIFIQHININPLHFFRNSSENNDEIKMLTYNIHHFLLHNPDSAKYRNYKKEIVQFVKENNFQIACFQEFMITEYNDSILKNLNFPYYYFQPYKFNKKQKKIDGIFTYSKYPIVNKGYLINEQNETFAIYTDLLINKDTFRLLNIHLCSIKLGMEKDSIIMTKSLFKINIAFKNRAKEVKKIKYNIKNSPYPVIICGDFNDTPASFAYHQLKNNLNDTYTASDFNIGNTYFWNIPPIRIDHILINKHFEALSYKVERLPYSDHYPVIATIKEKNKL